MLIRYRKRTLVALIFAWIAALLVVAWLAVEGHRTTLARVYRVTDAFARAVEQQTSRTFQAVNLTVGAVADAYELSPRRPPNDPEFQQMMLRRLKEAPFVQAIFIADRNGTLLHDAHYPEAPAISLATGPWLRAYQQGTARGVEVWRPVQSSRGSAWVLPVTRPLEREGAFDGLVVATVDAGQFGEQFRTIRLNSTDLIAVFHLDGTLVSSYPPRRGDVGRRFDELPLFAEHLPRTSDMFWSRSDLLPGDRLVSYRVVRGAPFVVYVSRSRATLLAVWRHAVTGAAVAMAALTLLLAWFLARAVQQAMQQQNERERRAQAEKLEALGHLSGGMAHDFANMLGIIATNVALLRRRPDDPQIREQALTTLERAVHNGTQVVERLLAFARRKPLSVTRVRLEAALEAARPLFAQAAGPRVTLTLEAAEHLPEVLCDAAQLDVALVNLVVNARDAMSGKGHIRIRVLPCGADSGVPKAFVAEPPRYVCVCVEDDGPGMTEDVRRRALEPFFTTKGDAGTGMGLAQVYGFMRQLGGNLLLESAPHRGTAVSLFFPVAPDLDPQSHVQDKNSDPLTSVPRA